MIITKHECKTNENLAHGTVCVICGKNLITGEMPLVFVDIDKTLKNFRGSK